MITLVAMAAEQAQSNPTGTQLLIAALGAGGFGAILAAIVTGLFSKRKLGAEATEIITKAAAGVVTNLENEIERLTKKARVREEELLATVHEVQAKMDDAIREHAAEREDVRQVLQLHVAWDALVRAKMAEHGVDLPPAPPLLPPRLSTRLALEE